LLRDLRTIPPALAVVVRPRKKPLLVAATSMHPAASLDQQLDVAAAAASGIPPAWPSIALKSS